MGANGRGSKVGRIDPTHGDTGTVRRLDLTSVSFVSTHLSSRMGTKHFIASTDTAAIKDRPNTSVSLLTEQRAAIQD
jgi:hypothetical protein